jgi:ribosomal-protein-alanine N-acetyltransferase
VAKKDLQEHRLALDTSSKDAFHLSKVKLRPFEATDLPALLHLDALCFPPQISYSRTELEYFVRHPRSDTTIAEYVGEIAGFCVVDWKLESGRKVGHFITIDVSPERRRVGLGRLLMQVGEVGLAGIGCIAITLEVATNNDGAQAFYERLGYQPTGRIPGYYADGTDALVLRKTLDSAG